MRVVLEEIIDHNSEFDMQALTNKQKISMALSFLVSNSAILGMEKKREKQAQENMDAATIANLGTSISSQISSLFQEGVQLPDSKVLKVKEQCLGIKKHQQFLRKALETKAVQAYDVKEVAMDPDILLCFPNIERRIMVKKHAIEG